MRGQGWRTVLVPAPGMPEDLKGIRACGCGLLVDNLTANETEIGCTGARLIGVRMRPERRVAIFSKKLQESR